MKKQLHSIIVILSIVAVHFSSSLSGAELSQDGKQFLAGYEKVRAALATDDLGTAQKAAADLGNPGAAVAQSKSLAEARTAFEKLSAEAIKLSDGQPGYHVAHCDMVKKDWVQTSTQISNPYTGKEMAGCGEIKK